LAAGAVAAGLPWVALPRAGAQEQPVLDPGSIPKFAQDLFIPRVARPAVVLDSSGKVVRREYTLTARVFRAQMLPPPLPQSTVMGYGAEVFKPGGGTEFLELSPGPTFENIRGIPNRTTFRNVLDGSHIFAVDPNLHWANPNAMEPVEPPFQPFPPGYPQAQSPLQHVTHTHGLVVAPQFDGTAEEWYDDQGHRGPSFVSNTYEQPNEQPSTQLFYHDHVMGVTRLDVYAGVVGAAYIIRDPNSPLDGPHSPLPGRAFEIPLAIASRSFGTDGELVFPTDSQNPDFFPYWTGEDPSQVQVVNGRVWPNLNVQRRQYRFRVLAAANMRVYRFQFDLNGIFLPFTVIGSDGGYLPKPLQTDQFRMGITERTDILVDFSQFAPGTQIVMRNTLLATGEDPNSAGQIMRFTVVDSPVVRPPALDPGLFPPLPALPTNAPTRTKVLVRLQDTLESDTTAAPVIDAEPTDTDQMRTIDGLGFSSPVTELPLIGSTEQWDLVNTNEEEVDDPDRGAHQIHIHLLEFQIMNRQEIDFERFRQDWFLFNGRRPISRPIVLDLSQYLIGDPIPPEANETGWKDTAHSPAQHVTRLRVRWAPQETPTGGVQPGQNQYPIDTQFPPDRDTFTGPGYVMHCHMLNHEDHEMMRPLATVFLWQAGVKYPVGRIVAFKNIDYRVRVAHTSSALQPPTTRFDLWERVNNNDGTWQPQIIYAVQDRVLFQGQLFQARHVHQALPGAVPPNHPEVWEPIPLTAKEQIVKFCDPNDPETAPFFNIGKNGTEDDAREVLEAALAHCQPVMARPSSGITENAVVFVLPDGNEFRPNAVQGTAFYETMSKLLNISVDTLGSGQSVTVNGRPLHSGTNYPLPPQRNMGYLIKVTGGATFTAR
jgi:FtsP/CotA-like multicopper oxidase with cupredoxin domain